MSEWKKVKLKDCCHSISDGDHLPPPKSDSGVPFVTIANIDATNHIDFGNTMFVPYEYYNNLNDIRKAKFNDILYSVVGSFGKPVLIKENKPFAFQRHIAILRPNKLIVDSRFLYYVMLSRYFYMQADTVAIGAAQRTISLTALRNMEVELPSMEIQHRIANILSRYDSLIENYQKQIKLLEEAAQRLYKEWFVDLHFPGHENTNIIDGVPEGWEKKPALDFFEMSIGKTPPRTQKQWFTKGSNGIPWVSISDMKDTMFVQETAEELTQDACENYNIKVVPKGTILLSFKLTVGRVAFAGADVCTNEAIAHFQKEGDEWKAYTLMYLRNYNYDSLGNTSGISKAVNSTIIKNMPFVMPCTAILQEFSQRVLPFIKQTENLQSQLRLLTEARDRLLPKLMSGELTLEARAEKEDLLATPCKRGWEEDEAK